MAEPPIDSTTSSMSEDAAVASASRSPRLLKSLVRTGLVRFLSSSGTMILSVVLARTLTKEDFGLFSFCMVTLVTLSMLARYGLDSTLLRFGGSAWHDGDKDRFRGYGAWASQITLRNSVVLALVGGLALFVIGSERWHGISVMTWMLIALTPWSLLYTISFVFKAAHRTPTGSLFEVGTINHMTVLVVLGMVFLGWTVTSYHVAITLLVCSLVVCGAGFLLLRLNGMWPTPWEGLDSEHPEFMSSCRDVVVIVVMQMLANWGAVFFLGFGYSDDEVAIFSAPARLAASTILLTNIVILVIAPRLSGLHKANEPERFQRMLQRGCLAVAGINVPILLGVAVLAPWVMQLMGPKYVDHWPLLSVIAIGQVIGIIAGLAPTVLCMTGCERIWRRATIVNAAFCIGLTGVLCHFYGPLGAAIGTATYQATQNWAGAILVRWHHGYWTIPRIPLSFFSSAKL